MRKKVSTTKKGTVILEMGVVWLVTPITFPLRIRQYVDKNTLAILKASWMKYDIDDWYNWSTSQQTFTYLKATIEIQVKGVTYVNLTIRHLEDAIDVFLMFLLLIFNILYTFF